MRIYSISPSDASFHIPLPFANLLELCLRRACRSGPIIPGPLSTVLVSQKTTPNERWGFIHLFCVLTVLSPRIPRNNGSSDLSYGEVQFRVVIPSYSCPERTDLTFKFVSCPVSLFASALSSSSSPSSGLDMLETGYRSPSPQQPIASPLICFFSPPVSLCYVVFLCIIRDLRLLQTS